MSNVNIRGWCKHEESSLILVYPSERLCMCQNHIKHFNTDRAAIFDKLHVIFTGYIKVSCKLLCQINHNHITCKYVVER